MSFASGEMTINNAIPGNGRPACWSTAFGVWIQCVERSSCSGISEDTSVEHIATIVNRSVAAVEVCLLRARLQLREMLTRHMRQQQ